MDARIAARTALEPYQEEPQHALLKRMHARRISDPAISTFEIEPNGRGWSYPVPDGGAARRWKALEGRPKYKWIPGKPPGVRFYHGPYLLEAVEEAGGVCWLASGEADVWALWSAGIYHVLSCYGESAVPRDLAAVLAAMGVLTVYIAPDRDETGERWAVKIAQRLKGSGVELDARRLPDALGNSADIGRAWQQYDRDGFPFERWLLGLPRFEPEPLPLPEPVTLSLVDGIPAGYRQTIIDALEVSGFGSYGFSRRNVSCPFHDDQNPSASLHHEKGLFCHACGLWYRWTDLGEQLGLGTLSEWRRANPSANVSSAGMSTELREKLCKAGLTNLARFLDAVRISGWEAGRMFTTREACEAVEPFGLSSDTVYRLLAEDIFWQNFPPNSLHPSQPENFAKKSERGRPARVYRLPSPAELSKQFGLDTLKWQHHDAMPAAALRSGKLYRAEVYAALPRRRPGQYARKTLAKRVGVTSRTARDYDKIAGLKVSPRFSREEFRLELLEQLPEQRRDAPGNRWLEDEQGRRYQPTRAGALRALSYSHTVFVVTQLANHYGP